MEVCKRFHQGLTRPYTGRWLRPKGARTFKRRGDLPFGEPKNLLWRIATSVFEASCSEFFNTSLLHKPAHACRGSHRHHNAAAELRRAEDRFASAEQRALGP